MKISLPENIKSLRKERRMTQEQLAEALGVTVGAVHKWESGASMPEIRTMLELADLFSVSVDSLLGYEMRGSSVESITERIKEDLRTKDFDSALSEAEKALVRYPNTFRIVYCCADAFERKGVETRDVAALRRAIELMERAIPLLSQNDDPLVSEVTIRSDIATCCIVLGQTDKGLEILKRYNAGGINNTLLGLTYSQPGHFNAEEAENYLSRGLGGFITNAIRCMSGYVNYFSGSEDIASAIEAAEWLIEFLKSLKANPEKICYFDKIISVFQAFEASMLMYLGKQQESEELLSEAYSRAAAFDAAPVYRAYSIKFLAGDIEKTAVSDDLGETAMAAVEKCIGSDERCRPALEKWERLKADHNEKNREDQNNE